MYVALHKEQHTIMESLVDHSYGSIDNGIKVYHSLQGAKSTELEAVFNMIKAQPEKYWISMLPCLSLVKWSQRRASLCNLSIMQRLKVSQQSIK